MPRRLMHALPLLALMMTSCAEVRDTGEFSVANDYRVTLANQDEFHVKVVFHPSPYVGVARISIEVPMTSKVGDKFSSALFYMKDRRGMIMNTPLGLDGQGKTNRYINLEVRSKYLAKVRVHLFYRNDKGRISSRYDIDMASYQPYEVGPESQ